MTVEQYLHVNSVTNDLFVRMEVGTASEKGCTSFWERNMGRRCLILHPKAGAIFGPRFALVVKSGGRDVGVA